MCSLIVQMREFPTRKVAEHLSPQDIQLDLEVPTKGELFAVFGRHMQRAHAMPQESVVLSLSHFWPKPPRGFPMGDFANSCGAASNRLRSSDYSIPGPKPGLARAQTP
jgi:hypothetical protein